MRPLLILAACGLLAAGEAPSPATPPAPAPSPAQPAQPAPRAYLGIAIDQAATAFDAKGLAILRVEPGSPAAVIGLAAGDRLTSFDGKVLKTQDELSALIAAKKPGDSVQLEATRAQGKDGLPQVLKLSAVLQPAPRSQVASLGNQLNEMQARIAELSAKNKEPSLAEVLQKLQDIQKDLPKAAEAFKKIYPNGEFRIAISLEITSDKTAPDPLNIEVGGMPADTAEKKPAEKKPAEKKPAEAPKPDAPKGDKPKP